MSIDQLRAVVPPPTHPIAAGPVSRWATVQAELEIELPTDYLDFALHYGRGEFNDPLWLDVWNPLDPAYINRMNTILDSWRKSSFPLFGPSGLPLDLFPSRPGVLPIGRSSDGMTLCWYTLGAASSWPLVLVTRESYSVAPFLGPLTSFLAQIHSEPFRTLMGPPWLPGEERGPVRFTPHLSLQ